MLEYYYAQLELCKKLLEQVNNAIVQLNQLETKYNDLKNSISKKYTISLEETSIEKRIKVSTENVSKTSKHLKGITIPKIMQAIAKIQAAIAEILRRMAEEAERQRTLGG